MSFTSHASAACLRGSVNTTPYRASADSHHCNDLAGAKGFVGTVFVGSVRFRGSGTGKATYWRDVRPKIKAVNTESEKIVSATLQYRQIL